MDFASHELLPADPEHFDTARRAVSAARTYDVVVSPPMLENTDMALATLIARDLRPRADVVQELPHASSSASPVVCGTPARGLFFGAYGRAIFVRAPCIAPLFLAPCLSVLRKPTGRLPTVVLPLDVVPLDQFAELILDADRAPPPPPWTISRARSTASARVAA